MYVCEEPEDNPKTSEEEKEVVMKVTLCSTHEYCYLYARYGVYLQTGCHQLCKPQLALKSSQFFTLALWHWLPWPLQSMVPV